MSDKNIKNLYDDIEAPAELHDRILSAMNNAAITKTKTNSIPWKRYILIVAAIMVVFTMVVSAVAIAYNIYNEMYMLPGMGLFDGFNENVLAMPKVLEFGEGTIEMAMTYEQDGVRKFYMTIYAEGGGYTGKSPEKMDYQKLEILFSDGTSIFPEGKPWAGGNRSEGRDGTPARYYFTYVYEYDNFPDEHEFTLKNNAGMSTDITLAQIEPRTMRITDNGFKRVKIIPAAEGSRIFSHNVEVINPSMAENAAKFVHYSIGCSWDEENLSKIIYKNGKTLDWHSSGSTGWGIPVFAADENADYKFHIYGENNFAYDFIGGEIDKIIIRTLSANLTFNDYSIKVNLPVPEKGELIEFDTPLKIADIYEFTVSISAIEREINNLIVYMSKDDISYSGNENISDISCSIVDSTGHGSCSGSSEEKYYYKQTIKIPNDHSGDTMEAYIPMLSYMIYGDWEIDFE
jgi:hypothetical protein